MDVVGGGNSVSDPDTVLVGAIDVDMTELDLSLSPIVRAGLSINSSGCMESVDDVATPVVAETSTASPVDSESVVSLAVNVDLSSEFIARFNGRRQSKVGISSTACVNGDSLATSGGGSASVTTGTREIP